MTFTELMSRLGHASLPAILAAEGLEDFGCDYCGQGSFKEVYYLGGDTVLKFNTAYELGVKEMEIYSAAIEAGFGAMFVPTEHVLMDIDLHSASLESDITDVFVQPFVRCDQYPGEIVPFLSGDYVEIPGVPFKCLRAFEGTPIAFIEHVIEAHGVGYFLRFAEWADKMRLCDLEDRNLGTYQGRPVIIDFLS